MAFYSFFILFLFLCVVPGAPSLPFVVLHGIGENCTSVAEFTESLSNSSGNPGYCLEVGNGAWDSVFMPLEEQVNILCDKVKEMNELKLGYNLVAFSQGNMVARGVIEFCDDAPPVHNYVSLAGPHAGIACIPGTSLLSCVLANNIIIKQLVYSDWVQDNVAPAGFYRIPDDIDTYLEKIKFLPRLNNERPDDRNETYKERFASLNNLVLIMFDNDTVLIPKETSWFGVNDGYFIVLPVNETKLYTEDWIGLKTLDEAGKVKFYSVPGNHGDISPNDRETYVVPFLKDDEPAPASSESKSENENGRMVAGFPSFIELAGLPYGSV